MNLLKMVAGKLSNNLFRIAAVSASGIVIKWKKSDFETLEQLILSFWNSG